MWELKSDMMLELEKIKSPSGRYVFYTWAKDGMQGEAKVASEAASPYGLILKTLLLQGDILGFSVTGWQNNGTHPRSTRP